MRTAPYVKLPTSVKNPTGVPSFPPSGDRPRPQ